MYFVIICWRARSKHIYLVIFFFSFFLLCSVVTYLLLLAIVVLLYTASITHTHTQISNATKSKLQNTEHITSHVYAIGHIHLSATQIYKSDCCDLHLVVCYLCICAGAFRFVFLQLAVLSVNFLL